MGIKPKQYKFSITVNENDEDMMLMATAAMNAWTELGFKVSLNKRGTILNNDFYEPTNSVPEDLCDELYLENLIYQDYEVYALDYCAYTADAFSMLKLLSGKAHNVHTGVAVHYNGKCFSGVASTAVYFREMTDEEINAYIDSGDPMDKAGSYGIQGGAALFAERLVGDYYNVMGLPVCKLGQVLRQLAPELMEDTL